MLGCQSIQGSVKQLWVHPGALIPPRVQALSVSLLIEGNLPCRESSPGQSLGQA
jgi:hypothetical protein